MRRFKLVHKNALQWLIQGCPLLEQLYLIAFDCSDHLAGVLNISSPILKKVRSEFLVKEMNAIFVDSTSLESLEYRTYGENMIL